MQKWGVLSKFHRWVRSISKAMAMIAGGLVFVMMILVVLDVGGRFILNKPLYGATEIVTGLGVMVTFLALVYVQVQKRHISIDTIKAKLPERAQVIIDFIMLIAILLIVSVVSWRLIDAATYSWLTGEASPGLVQVPNAPIRTILAIGFVVLSIIIFNQIIEQCMKRGRPPKS